MESMISNKKKYLMSINIFSSSVTGILLLSLFFGNNKLAYTGHDLHLDADVQAEGKIANIKLQITLASTNYGWDFVKTYTTGYAGLKKANFHEHIDVPENAKTGTYTLLIVVTDEFGEKTQSKIDFEVVKDLTLPSISDISLKVTSPSILTVSGLLNAPNKIDRLLVEVQSSAWTKASTFNDAAMVDQKSFALSKDIDISSAPQGHYHVNITLIDKLGKNAGYHYHFDK
jgi:hypothetical protein